MTARDRADLLFAKIVRARGACQRCTTGRPLHCAHVFPRDWSPATRTLELNALCLCRGCHLDWAHQHPPEFYAWARDLLGADVFDELERRARAICHEFDWDAEYQRLRERAKRLELIR